MTKKNHIKPCFHIALFNSNRNLNKPRKTKLYCFDKSTNNLYQSIAENLCFVNKIYSEELEKNFSKFEGELANVIFKIHENKNISDIEFFFFIRYLAMGVARDLDNYHDFREMSLKVKNESIKGIGYNGEYPDEIIPVILAIAEIIQNDNLKYQIIKFDTNNVLYCPDCMIVSCHPLNFKFDKHHIIPISHNTAVIAYKENLHSDFNNKNPDLINYISMQSSDCKKLFAANKINQYVRNNNWVAVPFWTK